MIVIIVIKGGIKKSGPSVRSSIFSANIVPTETYYIYQINGNSIRFLMNFSDLRQLHWLSEIIKFDWVHFFVIHHGIMEFAKKWYCKILISPLIQRYYFKSDKSIRILIEFPSIWYIVGLCKCNFRKLFLSFNEILSTQTKIDKYTHFAKINFFTHGSISPSILGLEKATIYQINANYMRNLQNFTVLL